MRKETFKQKIDRYLRISKTPLGSKYEQSVSKYDRGEISATDFVIECDEICSSGWRCDFNSLQDWKDESKKNK